MPDDVQVDAGRFDRKDSGLKPHELSDRFTRLRMDLDRSLRYCAAMHAMWSRWAAIAEGVGVLAASAAFLVVAGGSPPPFMATKAFAFLAALCSCLSIVRRASARAGWYLQKRKSLSELMGRMPLDGKRFSVATLQRLVRERLALEVDAPPVFGCLYAVCHNETCEAFGRPECKRELTWMQARVWRHFPIPCNPPSKGRPPARFRPRTPSRAKKVAR